MTDQPNVGTTEAGGATGNQPAVSQPTSNPIVGTPQSSIDLSGIAKSVELLTKEVRGIQSRSDKDKNETQRVLEEIKQHMAKGMTIEQAEQAVNENSKAREKDELLYKIAEKVGVLGSTTQPTTAGNSASVLDEATRVFAEYNVDPNDAPSSVLTLKGVELENAVMKLALKKSNQTRDSSESVSLGTHPAAEKSEEGLKRDYIKEFTAARGNRALGKSIQEKYQKLGLDTGKIGFNIS